MFEAKTMFYLYVETPLHAGTGRGLGAFDLPIQRERTTGYPVIFASGVKGSIKAEARKLINDTHLNQDTFDTIFGRDNETASEFASAISFGDARILLFPVRSLSGTFAWISSLETIAGFVRMLAFTGQNKNWNIPKDQPGESEVWVNGNRLTAGSNVVLEEYSFTPIQKDFVKELGSWLADNALPGTPEYEFWRQQLPAKLCILPENAYRDFLLYSTEVATHIKIDPDTKTVADGALWVTESLPAEALMYLPVLASASRNKNLKFEAKQVIQKVLDMKLDRIQMGGDETTGQGIVSMRFGGVA
jgi:CRISPR-associated protein Cmr4